MAGTDHTIYFDTPDRVLKKAGFSLRIRHRLDEDSYVQTVKSAGNGNYQRQPKTLRKLERENPFWM